MPEHVALYPGSFDPPTFGHLDIVERAAKVFDHLIVAVTYNSEKSGFFNAEERCDMLQELTQGIADVEVTHFKGLTVDFARERKVVTLIRGLRAVSDFEYEMTMAATNRRMYADCDTVSFMPSEEHMFISSRLVKEIAQLGGDVSHFVPAIVVERLNRKLA